MGAGMDLPPRGHVGPPRVRSLPRRARTVRARDHVRQARDRVVGSHRRRGDARGADGRRARRDGRGRHRARRHGRLVRRGVHARAVRLHLPRAGPCARRRRHDGEDGRRRRAAVGYEPGHRLGGGRRDRGRRLGSRHDVATPCTVGCRRRTTCSMVAPLRADVGNPERSRHHVASQPPDRRSAVPAPRPGADAGVAPARHHPRRRAIGAVLRESDPGRTLLRAPRRRRLSVPRRPGVGARRDRGIRHRKPIACGRGSVPGHGRVH